MSAPGAAFSGIASSYDDAFSRLPQVQALRARVHAIMRAAIPRPEDGGPARVLDLGCGTGIDAAWLAAEGHAVVACDPSAGMLRTARARARETDAHVRFVRMPAEHLAAVRTASLDAVVSDFGALNCVRDLRPVLVDAHDALRDNGVCVLCLMNRFSLTETVAYLQHGMWRQAFRRWRRSGVYVPVGGRQVLTWYHSLRDIKRMARGMFTISRVVGLNILTPPPSFTGVYARHPRLIARADAIERRIDGLPGISLLGDHFVVVLERFE